MEKLRNSIANDLLIMQKYRISTEEWFVTQLLFLSSEEERQKDDYIIKYYMLEGIPKTPLRDVLISLQEKGIITRAYKIPAPGQRFDPEAIIFNKNFLKDKFKYSLEMGYDLFDAYPHQIGQFVFNNITKIYNNLDDFCLAYGKAIRWNPEKHEEVMELLQWGIENQCISYGICEFIGSHKWETLRKQREDGVTGEMCIIEAI